MEKSIIEWMETVTKASNNYENNNSDLKRKYLIRNISAFNYIVSLINVNQGSFGTGYPFYALEKNLTGQLPIIEEQIRYNNELLKQAQGSKRTIWTCRGCLSNNYRNMPDLKQVCKPCPNMDNELKPRKVINRLPDVDMWMICKDGHVEEAENKLAILLNKYNIHTSDVDPVQTIRDIEEITQDIKNGIMPEKFLPIDAHIIEYSTIKDLIEKVPIILEQASRDNQNPYLPIQPKSYRKTWQYDDEAYNFIYDFLASFTEFEFVTSLDKVLRDTRNIVATTYSPNELYTFFLQAGTESSKRRNKTTALVKTFFKRIESWKTEKDLQQPDDYEELDI